MPKEQRPVKSAYAQAGVNIDVKMNAVGSIKQMVASTKTANVIGNIGAFGRGIRSVMRRIRMFPFL